MLKVPHLLLQSFLNHSLNKNVQDAYLVCCPLLKYSENDQQMHDMGPTQALDWLICNPFSVPFPSSASTSNTGKTKYLFPWPLLQLTVAMCDTVLIETEL